MNRVLAFLVVAVVAAQPLSAQKKIEQIAARVNGDIILKSEVDRDLDLLRFELVQQNMDPARIDQELKKEAPDVLRNLIDKVILVQIAKEAGLSAELDVQKTMEELRVDRKFATMEELERAIIKDYGDLEEFKNDIRTKFLTQQVVEHEVYGRIVVTQEEMRKYYDEHTKDFDKPAGVRLAEIVVLVDRRLPDQVAAQRKKIEDAAADLKKGDSFADVAKKYSEVMTAEDGGDMGFVAGDLKEQTNETVAKALEGLTKGQMTDILELSDAYVIYKITDKHNGGILSFDLAQNFIYSAIMSQIAPAKVREYLTKQREDGFVDVKAGFTDTGASPKSKKAAGAKP